MPAILDITDKHGIYRGTTVTLDIDKLEAAAKADHTIYPAVVILELIARLKAAENSDQHNFERWQACEEKLREAEKDAARISYLTSLDDEEFFNLMSDTRMMPEQFKMLIDEARSEWIVRLEKIGYAKIADKIDEIESQLHLLEDQITALPRSGWRRIDAIKELLRSLS